MDSLDTSVAQMDSSYFISIASLIRDTSDKSFSYGAKNDEQKLHNWHKLQDYVKAFQTFSDTVNVNKLSIATNIYQNTNGVPYYITMTSPLRRFADLVQQLQVLCYLEQYNHYSIYHSQFPTLELPFIYRDLFHAELMQEWCDQIQESSTKIRTIERQVLHHWMFAYLEQQCKQGQVIIKVLTEKSWRKDQQERVRMQNQLDYTNIYLNSDHVTSLPFFLDDTLLVTYDHQQEFENSGFQTPSHVQFLPYIHFLYFNNHPLYNFYKMNMSTSTILHHQKQQRNPFFKQSMNHGTTTTTMTSTTQHHHVENNRLKVRLVDLNHYQVEILLSDSYTKHKLQHTNGVILLKVQSVDLASHSLVGNLFKGSS